VRSDGCNLGETLGDLTVAARDSCKMYQNIKTIAPRKFLLPTGDSAELLSFAFPNGPNVAPKTIKVQRHVHV
jgi:hypothetical protein